MPRVDGIVGGVPARPPAAGEDRPYASGAFADDPIHKLLLDRDPVHGEALASQPTLSRFENTVRTTDLYRLADVLADTVIERHRRRLGKRCRRITLDFDPTDDPTHGQQEFTFFHGYYDTYCYLPLIGTMAFNDEAEQYLLCAVLRPGNAKASAGDHVSRCVSTSRALAPMAAFQVSTYGRFWVSTEVCSSRIERGPPGRGSS